MEFTWLVVNTNTNTSLLPISNLQLLNANICNLSTHSRLETLLKNQNSTPPNPNMSRTPSTTANRPSKSSQSPLKRLTHELADLRTTPNPSTLHLGPSTDSDLFHWEAVLKGPRDQSSPYAGGLWLLNISIPPNYPLAPPTVKFITPICHANVHFQTGEICLTLLTTEHWAPSYTLGSVMTAIQQLLSDPGLDSPLNVDVANLMREDDAVGYESLVRFWTAERRWQGEGSAGWITEKAPGTGGHLGLGLDV